MYPDECIQSLIEPEHVWWETCDGNEFKRGRLVWVFIPHVGQTPFTLIPIERGEDPTEHRIAKTEIRPLDIRSVIRYPDLPIPALPQRRNEVRTVYLAKKRPALILGSGGTEIPHRLRKDKPRSQTFPSITLAPFYGVDMGEKRAGYNPAFVERVRACEYPQFMWEKLPIKGAEPESIMRLDHMQPVPRTQDAVEFTDYCLSDMALLILDQWINWLLTGFLDDKSEFCEYRDFLMELLE